MKQVQRPHTTSPLAPKLPDWCSAVIKVLEQGKHLSMDDRKAIRAKWGVKSELLDDFLRAYAQALCVAAQEIKRRTPVVVEEVVDDEA